MRTLVENNPLFIFIDCLRTAVMLGRLPGTDRILKMLVWSIGTLLLGFWVFRKNKNKIMQHI